MSECLQLARLASLHFQMNPDQSQELLNNSEKFALLLAENLEVAGLSRTIESENISKDLYLIHICIQ